MDVRASAATAVAVGTELPAKAYANHRQVLRSGSVEVPTGLLFDTQSFAMMSIAQPPASETPDLNADKDGDRVLILVDGDLALQIGKDRFRLGPGEAVQIPRGVAFGKTSSQHGAHLLMIRAKPPRSFSIYR